MYLGEDLTDICLDVSSFDGEIVENLIERLEVLCYKHDYGSLNSKGCCNVIDVGFDGTYNIYLNLDYTKCNYYIGAGSDVELFFSHIKKFEG